MLARESAANANATGHAMESGPGRLSVMDIRILEEYCILAKTLNFTKTARSLFITQPTLSRHMMRLEKEVGVDLFVQSKTGCSLTRSGEVFLEECLAVVDHYRLAMKRAQDAHAQRIFLRVGGTLVRPALSSLHTYLADSNDHALDVDYVELNSDCLEALNEEVIDIAFMFADEESFDPEVYTSRILFSEPAMVILDSSHPLAQGEAVSVEDLSSTPLVLLSHSAFRDAFDVTQRMFALADEPFPFKIEIERNLERVFVRGLGNRALIFPKSAFDYVLAVFEPNVVALPLLDDVPHLFHACAVARNPVSPSVKELFSTVQRAVASLRCYEHPA